MPNVRTLRRRIRSVQNTAKVTKAMQMIAASKMRRAQERVVAGRPYDQKLRQVLSDLATGSSEEAGALHPLLERRPVQRVLVVHITPDRGLCGGLPSNVNRRTGQFILRQEVAVSVITVGKKGRDFMVRYRRDVKAVFTDLGDRPDLADTLPITHLVAQMYTAGEVDQVFLAHAQFVSTLAQHSTISQVLPVEPPEMESPVATGGYLYEPSDTEVFTALVPRFLEMQVYHAILESIASEQSARMVAMRNATENATEMVQDLTLELNKVRQESITKELLDIIGGGAALQR